jgi:hypothetical protein
VTPNSGYFMNILCIFYKAHILCIFYVYFMAPDTLFYPYFIHIICSDKIYIKYTIGCYSEFDNDDDY